MNFSGVVKCIIFHILSFIESDNKTKLQNYSIQYMIDKSGGPSAAMEIHTVTQPSKKKKAVLKTHFF